MQFSYINTQFLGNRVELVQFEDSIITSSSKCICSETNMISWDMQRGSQGQGAQVWKKGNQSVGSKNVNYFPILYACSWLVDLPRSCLGPPPPHPTSDFLLVQLTLNPELLASEMKNFLKRVNKVSVVAVVIYVNYYYYYNKKQLCFGLYTWRQYISVVVKWLKYWRILFHMFLFFL